MRGIGLTGSQNIPSCEIMTATTFKGQLVEEKKKLEERKKIISKIRCKKT